MPSTSGCANPEPPYLSFVRTEIPAGFVRLTRSGFNDLTKKLADLQDERIKLVEEIHKAAADKDVRENAPLEAARESQGMVMARIAELESTLKVSVIIGDTKPDLKTVRVGSTVSLKDTASGRVTGYQLVEPERGEPAHQQDLDRYRLSAPPSSGETAETK